MTTKLHGGKRVRNSVADVPAGWSAARELIDAVYLDGAKATRYKALQAVKLMARVAPGGPGEFGVVNLVTMKNEYKVGREPESVNSVLGAVRAVCGVLVHERFMERSPFDLKRDWFCRPKDPAAREDKYLTVEQLLRVFDQAELEAAERSWRACRRRALLTLVVYTGVRALEALRARRADLDAGAKTLRITDTDGDPKTAASRDWVPLPAAAAEVLEDWSQMLGAGLFLFPQRTVDRPWVGGTVENRALGEVKGLGERAGVPGVTLLALRHTFSTHAEQLWGLSREQIKRIMRHTTIDTQRNYQHRDQANLVRLVDKHDFRVFA